MVKMHGTNVKLSQFLKFDASELRRTSHWSKYRNKHLKHNFVVPVPPQP